jgi:hypothetical protein
VLNEIKSISVRQTPHTHMHMHTHTHTHTHTHKKLLRSSEEMMNDGEKSRHKSTRKLRMSRNKLNCTNRRHIYKIFYTCFAYACLKFIFSRQKSNLLQFRLRHCNGQRQAEMQNGKRFLKISRKSCK